MKREEREKLEERKERQGKLRRAITLESGERTYERNVQHEKKSRISMEDLWPIHPAWQEMLHAQKHGHETDIECYELLKILLQPLEEIKSRAYHPEGDMLYHSLQVFELAKTTHGYDIEFLQAALLHDVGKAIDIAHHAEAGADALEGFVTKRVLFLVRYHMDALLFKQGRLGHRKIVLLKNSEYFEDLMELRELDDKGRVPGADVDSLDQALDYLRELEKE